MQALLPQEAIKNAGGAQQAPITFQQSHARSPALQTGTTWGQASTNPGSHNVLGYVERDDKDTAINQPQTDLELEKTKYWQK